MDAYEVVLNMDTRTAGEKSTSAKEYMSELRSKVKKEGLSAAKDIVKDTMKIITDNIPSVNDAQEAVGNTFSSMFTSVGNFTSFVGNFMKTEDQKEIDKSIKEEQEADEIVIELNNEVAVIDENGNGQVATVSSYVKPIAAEAIKITDIKITNNWHKQFQDKLNNFIDVTKTQCFVGATKMLEEANRCELKSIEKASAECRSLKQSANLVMKNCAVMFPMESSYDEMIGKMLNYASDASVNISANGDMSYLAAGEVASQENVYVGQDVNALPMPSAEQANQMLLGGVDGNSASGTGNLLEAPHN